MILVDQPRNINKAIRTQYLLSEGDETVKTYVLWEILGFNSNHFHLRVNEE